MKYIQGQLYYWDPYHESYILQESDSDEDDFLHGGRGDPIPPHIDDTNLPSQMVKCPIICFKNNDQTTNNTTTNFADLKWTVSVIGMTFPYYKNEEDPSTHEIKLEYRQTIPYNYAELNGNFSSLVIADEDSTENVSDGNDVYTWLEKTHTVKTPFDNYLVPGWNLLQFTNQGYGTTIPATITLRLPVGTSWSPISIGSAFFAEGPSNSLTFKEELATIYDSTNKYLFTDSTAPFGHKLWFRGPSTTGFTGTIDLNIFDFFQRQPIYNYWNGTSTVSVTQPVILYFAGTLEIWNHIAGTFETITGVTPGTVSFTHYELPDKYVGPSIVPTNIIFRRKASTSGEVYGFSQLLHNMRYDRI